MKTSHCIAIAAAIGVSATAASATTRSSFNDANYTGITVTHQMGLTYLVSMDTAPTLTLGTSTYAITDLIGFYALSNTSDFTPFATLSQIGDFKDDSSNSGPGGIQGWKSNPNKGITPGGSHTFTFNGLDQAHNDQWGFHFRVDGALPGGGNTGSFTRSVPAPASLALTGLAGIACLRRRR
ncbi:MAG: PEP-CTERM sorting domain-containing protein [Phycisphaerales bacterium]|nr:PEP-CTERM sorting domain-containing protein [Phycisphaerales bacterium]